MPWSLRWQLALRQTFDPGRGLSAFLSRVSMMGLILAVALLLAVLSVMNGFERDMRERILALLPHVTIQGYASEPAWQSVDEALSVVVGVRSIQPFLDADALLLRGDVATAVKVLGLERHALARYAPVLSPRDSTLSIDGVFLGGALADRLGLAVGDGLTVIAPAGRGERTPQPVRLIVEATLHTGTELDESLALVDLRSVQRLLGADVSRNGVALQLDEVFQAPRLRHQLNRTLPTVFFATDWTVSQGNLYTAIQLSRNIVGLLLLSVIAVAAFNVVSSLTLVVTDRRAPIAMLRAVGARQSDIAWIFLLQGALIGALGALIGLILGGCLALSLPSLAEAMSQWMGRPLLSTEVYPLSYLPVDLRAMDCIRLMLASLGLCLFAALLPALRASQLPIAKTLEAKG